MLRGRSSTAYSAPGTRLLEPAHARELAHNSDTYTRAERAAAVLGAGIVFITIALWTAFGESAARYVIYSLPITLALPWLLAGGQNAALTHKGLVAMAIYVGLAVTSIWLNGSNQSTQRDVWILCSIITLFIISTRSPPWLAGCGLATLAAGLLIEAPIKGVQLSVNLVDSTGILESALAMPLGVLVVYFYWRGQKPMTMVAGLLCFVAFKRIVILAVLGAILLSVLSDFMRHSERTRFAIAVVVSVLLSVIALNLQLVFGEMQTLAENDDFSANRLSLGRFEIAQTLWQEWAGRELLNTMFGFGPGAADAVIWHRMGSEVLTHNDWLKLLFDYGVAGVVAFHLIFMLLFGTNRLGSMLYVFSSIVMMTDNIILYLYHFVFVAQVMQIPDLSIDNSSRQARLRVEHA
ncbi:MAG: O-antigen ligase family protein [Hyphomicrobium sp.]